MRSKDEKLKRKTEAFVKCVLYSELISDIFRSDRGVHVLIREQLSIPLMSLTQEVMNPDEEQGDGLGPHFLLCV